MTVEFPRLGWGTCLSSDIKPTKPAGWQLFEWDTYDTLISDGTYWWLGGFPSPLSPRRIGYLSFGPSSANGPIGLLSNLSAATGAGGSGVTTNNVIQFSDNTGGRYYPMTSGIVAGNRGGIRQANTITTFGMSPKIRFRFKLVTNPLQGQQLWLGFIGGNPTEPSGNNPFGAGAPGVVFGINSTIANANWSTMNNGTTGNTVVTDTTIPYDVTNIHTVNIVGDFANSRFAWNLDGGAYTFLTGSTLPTSSNALGIIAEIETESTTASQFNLYGISIQTER